MRPKSRGIDSSRQLDLDGRLLLAIAMLFLGGVLLYGGILVPRPVEIVVGALLITWNLVVIVRTLLRRRRPRR